MHSEEQALLAAVIANPEEDTPRLAYADWLQEHGRPERAEFIRAQVWLSRTKGAEGFEHQRQEWHHRVRELLHEHAKQWRKELPRAHGVRWEKTFTRGFVERVYVSVDEWNGELAERLTALLGLTPSGAYISTSIHRAAIAPTSAMNCCDGLGSGSSTNSICPASTA